MIIADFLSPEDVFNNLKASNQNNLLNELSSRAAARLQCSAEELSLALQNRENLGSTGMGGGVAIPHARFSFVKKPFGMLAKLKQAIDFGAIDGNLVDIYFLLLLPSSKENGQLGSLAMVARRLRDQKIIATLRGAKTNDELYSAMTSTLL